MGRPKRLGTIGEVIVEDFSYDPISGVLSRCGREVKTVGARGYKVINVQGKVLYAHRVAWFLHHGSWPMEVIDHINRVKIDNRLSNLRDVTQAVNVENSGLRTDSKSGYRNVSWDTTKGKWSLRKTYCGSYKFMGYFNCPTAANLHLLRLQGVTS